ncbi:hypothetical protein BKA64DRAFT_742909 [Cadophora sp. MPI-SDFR-AT-0126]|nr:hypothetical protein BKA64DRAFT_742909 [Leotiomycetes sp. MPI-SDFR-AT-0126]
MPSIQPTVKYRKMTPVKLTEFKKYPKLPLELKNIIVKLATPTAPKVITIGIKRIQLLSGRSTIRATASYKKPVFLDVDSSSREVVSKMFTAAFAINLNGAPVYVNFKTDALIYDCSDAAYPYSLSITTFNDWGSYELDEASGPSANQYPTLMVRYGCRYLATLSPLALERLGRPAFIVLLDTPRGSITNDRFRKLMARAIIKSMSPYGKLYKRLAKTYPYNIPSVSYKTPSQMLEMLDNIEKDTIEEDRRRAKVNEISRNVRVLE